MACEADGLPLRSWRMTIRRSKRSIGLIAWVSATLGGVASAQNAPAVVPATGYVRVTQTDDGALLRLEVASRRFTRKGVPGPDVRLTGAVHVADAAFYASLQSLMDGQDVVLFESVKPSGLGDRTGDETDEHRIKVTERRMRLLAIAVERSRTATGSLPDTMDALEAGVDERFAKIIAGARSDGWGRLIVFESTDEKYDIVSQGADGLPGGEGVAADLRFSDQKALSSAERGEGGPGMQKQLADALGLVFQPEAMSEGGPNWRNSDMSVDQVQDRLEASGAGGEQLFRMLSGESFGAKLAGLVLKFATGNERSRAMMKVMMVEMLGAADEILASGMGGMAGGEGLMKVLIADRNEVVINDLKGIISGEPDVKTVGILYGAGHLADMESRIGQLGYEPADEEWLPAITVDLNASGITAAEAEAIRNMMRSAIDRQRPKPAPKSE
jgi:hypothetical protein